MTALVAGGGFVRRGRSVPLRRRLVLLAVAAILPLALASGVGLKALVDQQRLKAQSAGLDLSRALATAVNAELRRSMAVAEALSASPLIEADNLVAYHALLERVLSTQPDWRGLLLSDPDGTVLLRTGTPYEPGAAGTLAERDSFDAAVRTQLPTVGYLARGPQSEWGIAVRLPMLRGGRLQYVLSAVLKPEAVLRVVQRQRVPQAWVVAVFDGRGLCVARSRGHERSLGQRPSPTLQGLLASREDEGMGATRTLEGEMVYTAYVRLPETGWTVAVGTPTAEVDREASRALQAYGGGLLLSLLLGGLTALALARSINRPIDELRKAAVGLGRGETPQLPASNLIEVQAVADALEASARQRARSEAERESLLSAERAAHAAAERARERLELLASAGTALSGSLEPQATLAAVAATLVPAVADGCRVELLGAKGEVLRSLTHHRDDALRRRFEAAVGTSRLPAQTIGSMAWAAATGRSFDAHFDSEQALASIPDPVMQRFAREVGVRAYFVVPLVARGRTIGVVAVIQADSERSLGAEDRALIAELAQRAALALDNARLYAEAEAARESAESANRAKDEFLAMLGHELRNPLAPIVTALHLMRMRRDDHSAMERGIIERQVAHLSRLVDDLLDVSRITRGKVQLDCAVLDLRSVVDRALELIQPALAGRQRGIEVVVPREPVCVNGDAVRLTQVLCNLLTNAIKFTPGDGRIALRVTPLGGAVEVSVDDSGAGIAPHLLERVFDLFVQGEQALDRRAGGLGLGLAIVKVLVEMHGGSVSAMSAGAGQGSRFVVRLPTVVELPALADPAAAAGDAARASGRVLLVDDNLDAAAALEVALTEVGYEVRTAADADAALATLAQFDADVAVLDIGLPGMDGYELARLLRDDPRHRHVRLVALTGYGREPDRQRALAAHFDEHLVKPAPVPRLLALLRELIARAPNAT
ncbi:ATP-binding protein [Caldimonas brevitalea]|uniref:histidine kinase n=1 Tax=Caldimonas brevitalea TaxID=413882 RepID=A0A0G3BR66_9BURK|nr:ATP-binding protein [Caldimonas brevitalea]AKJ29846.1 chemotaxis protein methyltransferase CheR [Caldimonas brevitalea]